MASRCGRCNQLVDFLHTVPAYLVSGLVEQVNAKGTSIKVAGQWLNASEFHAVTLPQAG